LAVVDCSQSGNQRAQETARGALGRRHGGQSSRQADDSEVALQKADKGRLLRRCIDALSTEYREIVDLVYFHELSVAEASAVLGIPEGTVKTRLFNARKRLSVLLKDAGVDRGWP